MNHALQAYLLQCADHDPVTVDQANDRSTYSNLNAVDILKVFCDELIGSGMLDILEEVKDHNPDDNELFISTHVLRAACQRAKEIMEGGE